MKKFLSLLCLSAFVSLLYADTNTTNSTSQSSEQMQSIAETNGASVITASDEKTSAVLLDELKFSQASVDDNPSLMKVSQKDFKQGGADNVADALRRTQGIYVRDAIGGDPVNRLYMRGLNKASVLIDGIPMIDIYKSENNFAFFTTQGIESIELAKGFIAPAYSAMGGGILNLKSAKPQSEFELSLHLKAVYNNVGIQEGSFYKQGDGHTETLKTLSIGTNQGLYYFQALYTDTSRGDIGFSKDYTDTFESMRKRTINGRFENRTIKLQAGFTPNDDEYSLTYINQKGGKGDLLENVTIERLITSTQDGTDYPVYDSQVAYFSGKTHFTPNLYLDSKLYYQAFDKKRIIVTLDTLVQKRSNSNVYDYDTDNYGAILNLNYELNTNSKFEFGLNVKRNHHISTYGLEGAFSNTSKRDIFNVIEWQSSLFTQYAQRLGDFRLIVAGSYDRADITRANAELNAPAKTLFTDEKHSVGNKFSFGNFSLQAMGIYDISGAQNVFISVGKKNIMPNLATRYGTTAIYGTTTAYAYNKNLKPESMISYELGYNLNLPSTKINTALFFNDLYNMLETRANGANVELTNANEGYMYGGEFGVEQGFFSENALTLGANYSYVERYGKGAAKSEAGRKLEEYPNHIANAKIAIKPVQSFELVGLGTYHSRPRIAQADKYMRDNLSEYIVFDMIASFYFSKGLSVSAGIYNLADRDNIIYHYGYSTAQQATNLYRYHLSGRRYFIGFDYKYQK